MLQMLVTLLALVLASPPATCTYDTWTWSVVARRVVEHQHVSKPYAQVTEDEKASDWNVTGCTTCREDQERVAVSGLPPVLVCRHFAPRIREALEAALQAGARIETLVGYRVGRSGGPVVDGKRTRYGWHAFGEALDINSKSNGLYGNCKRNTAVPRSVAELGPCRLRVGEIGRAHV